MKHLPYICAKCHNVFEAPNEAFDGFREAVRIAAHMGTIKKGVVDLEKVPVVNPCCPDCFAQVQPAAQS